MNIYFWILRLAALFGHRKARKLVDGQSRSLAEVREWLASLGGRKVVWVHVASVGEFEQARPILERLRREQPQRRVLLTFFSPSGYELRKDYPLVDKVAYLPFATRRNAKKWLSALPLEMAVFVKYEFWPAYLKALKKHGVTTYLISAIFRPGQLFFLPWGRGYRKLLHCFEHIFVQDLNSATLLQKYGVHHVTVAGDTRFDRVLEVKNAAKDLPIVDGFVAGAEHVIIAGSTWQKDEQFLVRYMSEREGVKLVLVPHEIDAKHLYEIFQYFDGRFVRYTEATAMSLDKCRILLVDTIGVLSSIYRYGHVAYIGGGFGVGIHNTLEAAAWGMPVVFGPNYHKFQEAKELIECGAGQSIKNYEECARALDEFFEKNEVASKAAAEYVASHTGATELIHNAQFTIHNL